MARTGRARSGASRLASTPNLQAWSSLVCSFSQREAGALCMRFWKPHSRFYVTTRSDEVRRDSLAADVTGLLEIGGDPLAFARLRPEQKTTRIHTTSRQFQTKGLSYRVSFAKLPVGSALSQSGFLVHRFKLDAGLRPAKPKQTSPRSEKQKSRRSQASVPAPAHSTSPRAYRFPHPELRGRTRLPRW